MKFQHAQKLAKTVSLFLAKNDHNFCFTQMYWNMSSCMEDKYLHLSCEHNRDKAIAFCFFIHNDTIDNANNLIFWCHFLNKLKPWHIVYIMHQ